MTVPWLEEPVAAWPDALPPHLSPSSLSTFERCPEMYRRKYILREQERTGASALWGNADGEAHFINFAQKIDSHEDLPVADVREAFAESLDSEIRKNGGREEIDWRDDKPGDVMDRGVALVSAYHAQVSPRIQPTGVEERFSIDVPGVPVPFIGYVDVSTEPASIERKTAAQKSSAIPPQYRLQTLGYALARERPVEVHISTRTLKPAVWTPAEEPALRLEYAAGVGATVERIIAARATQIAALYAVFGPDDPWPDALGTMAWHTPICDLCSFRPTCSWWAA